MVTFQVGRVDLEPSYSLGAEIEVVTRQCPTSDYRSCCFISNQHGCMSWSARQAGDRGVFERYKWSSEQALTMVLGLSGGTAQGSGVGEGRSSMQGGIYLTTQ